MKKDTIEAIAVCILAVVFGVMAIVFKAVSLALKLSVLLFFVWIAIKMLQGFGVI